MTDCYLCGHPILEGQKAFSHFIREDLSNPVPVHANPADHLPTLLNSSESSGRFLTEAEIVGRERERAAKMVKDHLRGALSKHDAHGWSELAERILKGE